MNKLGQTQVVPLQEPKMPMEVTLGLHLLAARVEVGVLGPQGMEGEQLFFTLDPRTIFSYLLMRRRDISCNPGNNLHVSGLSHKVDTRELEQAFAKVGRVSTVLISHCLFLILLGSRSRRHRSCMIPTHVNRVDLVSSRWSQPKRQKLLSPLSMVLISWVRI